MVLSKFSERALQNLKGYYVYALIDPRTNRVFYIGKGTDDRVFAHEIEQNKDPESENRKLKTIHAIESDGYCVKKVLLNWGLEEKEAFVAEAALINYFKFVSHETLTNIVAGHHTHEALTVEEFEKRYGAKPLSEDEIEDHVMVIKINEKYHWGMSDSELYEVVRGIWKANIKRASKVKYVVGVYNQLVVAVYKPKEWHYVHEKRNDVPRPNEITKENYEKVKGRIYFICDDYKSDERYLHRSIADLSINQSAQNPISYIEPKSPMRLFAKKWCDKFRIAETNYYEFIDPKDGEPDMGAEMRELGFKMDCGNAFMSVYGNAINDEKELRKIIDCIHDVELLGSAIYSKWRYYNHWAYSGAEILEPQNRKWFILALRRLAELT